MTLNYYIVSYNILVTCNNGNMDHLDFLPSRHLQVELSIPQLTQVATHFKGFWKSIQN